LSVYKLIEHLSFNTALLLFLSTSDVNDSCKLQFSNSRSREKALLASFHYLTNRKFLDNSVRRTHPSDHPLPEFQQPCLDFKFEISI